MPNGKAVEYKVTVTNIGNQKITGIKLTDKVNDTTTITTADFTDSEGNVTEGVTLADFTFELGVGESAYFTYSYEVTEADIAEGTIVNAVTSTTRAS